MNEAMERLRARQNQAQGMNVLDAIMQPRPASQDDIVQIPGRSLHGFSGHTFKLRPDEDPYMVSLLDSIRVNGILEPLLVRPHPSLMGEYEIIAGHTRHHLGQRAGLTVFPCVVRALGNADAVIQMGESNLQRPDWLPSEKARTYKAHLEAIRELRYGQVRPGHTLLGEAKNKVFPGNTLPGEAESKVFPGNTYDITGEKTRDLAAKRWGISGLVLDRYIKLNDLRPDLLDMVDGGRIPVKAGFQLAFLPVEDQGVLLELLLANPAVKVNEAAAKELRCTVREEFPQVLGLRGKPAKRPTWSVALPRDLLPEGVKKHLADPELQERIAAVVREYVAEQEEG